MAAVRAPLFPATVSPSLSLRNVTSSFETGPPLTRRAAHVTGAVGANGRGDCVGAGESLRGGWLVQVAQCVAEPRFPSLRPLWKTLRLLRNSGKRTA